MAEEILSSWDGEEGNGGLFNEGIVTINGGALQSVFGYHENYQNGDAECFILRGSTDQEDFPEVEFLYSIGKGWSIEDDGDRVSGRDTFLKSTNYFALIASAFGAGLGDVLKARGEATEAKVWDKLVVRMKRVEYTLPGLVLREGQRPLNRVIITEAIGGESTAKAAAKATTKTTKAETVADKADDAPAASGGAGGGGGGGLPLKLKVALGKLAKEHDDHDDFMAAALDVDGVAGNEAAEDAIQQSGPGSLYFEARNK
jgi:hypothetical protein